MTPSINADYFDGVSSRRRLVTIVVRDGTVLVSGDGIAFEVAAAAVKISARMSGMPRRLEFPDGAAAVTQDNEEVDEAFEVAGQKTLAHRLESHRGFVVGALILTIAVCWAGYRYGVPWTAREIALRLPSSLESELAEESLKALDGFVFRPTQLTVPRQVELARAFTELRDAAGQPKFVRLEFRDGNWIGANALALPGGIVVMTDQLVKRMANDNQIVAVLAHELGHIQHRHSLRYVLQDSIAALVGMAIYGDASAVAGIAITMPTVLVHAQYSQGFEREADTYAFELLKRTGRSPRELGQALTALAAEEGKASEGDDKSTEKKEAANKGRRSRGFGYLSTHPATEERVQAAEEASR